MHINLRIALKQINTYWRYFEHNGQNMTKKDVVEVLKYGISKGYKSTSELKNEEIESIINKNKLNDTKSY